MNPNVIPILSLIFGILLTIGAFSALIPLNINIIKKRSTKGISFVMIWIGVLSAFSSAVNIILQNWTSLQSCKSLGALQCAATSIIIVQFLGVWIMYSLTFLLCFIFQDEKKGKSWVFCILLFCLYIIAILAGVITSTILLIVNHPSGKGTLGFADALGLISAGLVILQWSPQIFQTFRLRSKGNFSMVTICIQAPGSWIVLTYLLVLGRQPWTAWLPYLTAGIQQVILLILFIFFDCWNSGRKRRKGADKVIVVRSTGASGEGEEKALVRDDDEEDEYDHDPDPWVNDDFKL